MKTLEDYLSIHESKTARVKDTLTAYEGCSMLWQKTDTSFYILSKSVKEEGFQLTYFFNNEPISDKIRDHFLHRDIVEELALNDCTLKEVI